MILFFRLCGMFLVVICTSSIGLSMAQALDRRVKELETAGAVLSGLSGELRYSLAPPDAAVQQLEERDSLAAAGYLPACSGYCRRGLPFPQAWKRAVEERGGALAPEDRLILSSLSDTLGQCDLDGQLARLEQAQRLLALQLENARERCVTRGKLYRTMGVLAGAFIVVLFI